MGKSISFRDFIGANKKEGDKWYCYQAPEQFHVWTAKHKWPTNAMEVLGMQPLSIKVSGSISPAKPETQRYTRRKPLTLSSGVTARGQTTTRIVSSAHFDFRVDSTRELTDCLLELCGVTKQTTFSVEVLELTSKKRGYIITFRRINPDGNGTSLYFHDYIKDGRKVLFPAVMLQTQSEILGDFKETLAQCSYIFNLSPYCALKGKRKNTQTRLRKS